MKIRWRLATLLVALGSTAMASDETGKGYVMPLAGHTRLDSHRAFDDDMHFGFGVGKHLSKRWSVELATTEGRFDALDGQEELALTTVSLDLLRVFNRGGRVSPFVSAGVGYIEDNYDAGPTTGDVLGQLGLGLMIDVAQNAERTFVFQLRPEVRARMDGNDSGVERRSLDYTGGLNFVLAFGPPWRPSLPVRASLAPEAPAQQDQFAAVHKPEVHKPETRSGSGNASPPPAVNTTEAIPLETVYFDFASGALTGDSLLVLNRLGEQLSVSPYPHLEVQGHTDATGDPCRNRRLSQVRADAVREYLIGLGVRADRVRARGYGQFDPVADNDTELGRAKNRRVVIAILPQ